MSSDVTDNIPASPYRGIHPFRYVDRARFFGREEITTELLAKTLVSRVVVLFGESGTGKSSLINAGLIPALEREGLCPERLRVRPISGEPILIERIPTRDDEPGVYLPSVLVDDDPTERGARGQFVPCTLERLLKSVREADAYPVLIFDQFEEIFTLFDQSQEDAASARAVQASVLNTVLAIASHPSLRAKVIIVIREDYLGKLEVLARDYPQVFDRRVRLQRLIQAEARKAMLGPFEGEVRFCSRLASELAEEVIQDLTRGDPEAQVQPTQLQIICDRLWQAYAATRPLIGVTEYEELRRVQGIIEGFLEAELAGLDPVSRSHAVFALGQLITESRTRDVVSEDRLRAVIAATEKIADDALADMLGFLERRRLVQRTPQRGTYYYEIASEYLIPPVHRMAREEAQRRAAEEAGRRARAAARLWLLVALALVFVVAVGGAAVASMGWTRARANAQIALSRQLAAQALYRLDDDLDLAMLLAAQAYQTRDTPEARRSLFATIQTSPSLLTFLHGHSDQVTALAFRADGAVLVSAGSSGRVLSWDTTTGRSAGGAAAIEVDEGSRMALSPDGRLLALGYSDGTVSLWDTQTDQGTQARMVGHGDKVDALAFAPDGRALASAGRDKRILLWDLEHGERTGELSLEDDADRPSSIALSPGAHLLASGGANGAVLLWRIETGRVTRRLPGHADLVRSLAFSPDGTRLASGGADGRLLLWDVASGELVRQLSTAYASQITSIAFAPGATKLAFGSADGTLLLWDLDGDSRRETRLVGHSDGIVSIVFSSDGAKLASGGTNGTVLVWHLTGAPFYEQPVAAHTSPASCVAFSPDGSLAVGYRDGRILLRRTAAGALEEFSAGHTDQISQLAFDPRGATLASRGWDGTVRFWEVRRSGASPMWEIEQVGPTGPMVFASDGARLTSYSQGGNIAVWDVIARERMLLYGTSEPPEVSAAALGQDGEILAAGYADGAIRLWRASKGKFLGQTLREEGSRVTSLAFTANGQTLAWGDASGALVLWDIDAATIAAKQAVGQSSSILALAFSADGDNLASGDAAGALTLWRVDQGMLSALPLAQRSSAVVGLALRPDGKEVASLDSEGTATLWNVSADAWRDYACRVANRRLTLDEWREFLGDEPYRQACPGTR